MEAATAPVIGIGDVTLHPLTSHHDDRGSFTEIFRESWAGDFTPVQWNYVRSGAGVLRGVHGHVRHSDCLILLEGVAMIGLKDLRPDSPSRNQATLVTLSGTEMQALTIPAGVAHGFYFPQPSALIYAVTDYWNTDDELVCRWDDPGLGIPWPCKSPSISPRDAALPEFSTFAREMAHMLDRASNLTLNSKRT